MSYIFHSHCRLISFTLWLRYQYAVSRNLDINLQWLLWYQPALVCSFMTNGDCEYFPELSWCVRTCCDCAMDIRNNELRRGKQSTTGETGEERKKLQRVFSIQYSVSSQWNQIIETNQQCAVTSCDIRDDHWHWPRDHQSSMSSLQTPGTGRGIRLVWDF